MKLIQQLLELMSLLTILNNNTLMVNLPSLSKSNNEKDYSINFLS